jgi:antitoxin component of RelBE/YafQ-DinJ toxin-antitoxin module
MAMIRVDVNVKNRFDKFSEEHRLTQNNAIKMLLKVASSAEGEQTVNTIVNQEFEKSLQPTQNIDAEFTENLDVVNSVNSVNNDIVNSVNKVYKRDVNIVNNVNKVYKRDVNKVYKKRIVNSVNNVNNFTFAQKCRMRQIRLEIYEEKPTK